MAVAEQASGTVAPSNDEPLHSLELLELVQTGFVVRKCKTGRGAVYCVGNRHHWTQPTLVAVLEFPSLDPLSATATSCPWMDASVGETVLSNLNAYDKVFAMPNISKVSRRGRIENAINTFCPNANITISLGSPSNPFGIGRQCVTSCAERNQNETAGHQRALTLCTSETSMNHSRDRHSTTVICRRDCHGAANNSNCGSGVVHLRMRVSMLPADRGHATPRRL